MANNNPKYKPKLNKKIQLQYIPHGIDHTEFRPLNEKEQGKHIEKKDDNGNSVSITEYQDMLLFKKYLFGGKEYDFVVFFNNRNIRRKSPGDVILAFKTFVDKLTTEQKEKTALLMHTVPVDDNGTDLLAVKEAVATNINLIFSTNKLSRNMINYLYNISDVTINIASNEGYGLSTAESLLAGTPIIVNITGGLQDQCGFTNDDGEYLDPEKDFNFDFGSNHTGKYKNHGKWVYPLFPTNRSLVGSPPTPYIFDDRCSFEDAADAMIYWYNTKKETRKEYGLFGRQFMIETGMTSQSMGLRFIDYIEDSISNWESKKRFTIFEI